MPISETAGLIFIGEESRDSVASARESAEGEEDEEGVEEDESDDEQPQQQEEKANGHPPEKNGHHKAATEVEAVENGEVKVVNKSIKNKL